jgi:hypothetical protein
LVVKRKVFADKCVSGGVVNAYNALKVAAEVAAEVAKGLTINVEN